MFDLYLFIRFFLLFPEAFLLGDKHLYYRSGILFDDYRRIKESVRAEESGRSEGGRMPIPIIIF